MRHESHEKASPHGLARISLWDRGYTAGCTRRSHFFALTVVDIRAKLARSCRIWRSLASISEVFAAISLCLDASSRFLASMTSWRFFSRSWWQCRSAATWCMCEGSFSADARERRVPERALIVATLRLPVLLTVAQSARRALERRYYIAT